MEETGREELREARRRAVERIRAARRGGKPSGLASLEIWTEALRREEPRPVDVERLRALAEDRERSARFLEERAGLAEDPERVRAAAALFAEAAERARAAEAPTPELLEILFDLQAAAAELLEPPPPDSP